MRLSTGPTGSTVFSKVKATGVEFKATTAAARSAINVVMTGWREGLGKLLQH